MSSRLAPSRSSKPAGPPLRARAALQRPDDLDDFGPPPSMQHTITPDQLRTLLQERLVVILDGLDEGVADEAVQAEMDAFGAQLAEAPQLPAAQP